MRQNYRRRYTKKEALQVVFSCAKEYKKHLVGKTLLFICMDKHKNTSAVTFSFDAANYLHLTGLEMVTRKRPGDIEGTTVRRKLSAAEFYKRCLNQTVQEEDFEFSNKGTTELKLEVLPSLMTKNLSAKQIGDFRPDRPQLMTEKLAGNTMACIGFVQDQSTGRYVPNTVLKEDIKNLTFKTQRVIACYRKPETAARFEEVTHVARNIDWDSVVFPEEYAYLKDLIAVKA